jgi:hypothetical protein
MQPDLRSDDIKAIDAAIAKARADERDECARIAEDWRNTARWQKSAHDAAEEIAQLIRSRSNLSK